jgi:hypothetical protein
MQVDGPVDEENTFISEYAEEDILFTLDEIFPERNSVLDSLVQSGPQSADYAL